MKPATDEDMGGKLEDLRRLMGQFTMPEGGEFTESEIDKYVSGVRVYEDHFEWQLNLSPDTRNGRNSTSMQGVRFLLQLMLDSLQKRRKRKNRGILQRPGF